MKTLARRRRRDPGNEAPMVITPHAVVDLVRRIARLLRRRSRQGER